MDGGFSQYETGVTLPESPFGTRWHFYTGGIGNEIMVSDGDNNQFWKNGIGPVDAYTIDRKLDDGSRFSGRIRGGSSISNTCSAWNTSDYYKDRNEIGCVLHFKLD